MLVLEDCLGVGCVGQRIAAILAQRGCCPSKMILKNLGVHVAPHGSVSELYEELELDASSVAYALEEALK